jgi:serine/threonine protein kinase
METLAPNRIVEWIPYNKLQNIEYLTKGGCSEIYTAVWIDGRYDEWNTEEKQLKRYGGHDVILKKLENVESANRSWFDEVYNKKIFEMITQKYLTFYLFILYSKIHLSISNKQTQVVQCYGLTKDPSDGNYILVLYKLDFNLREYLQQNHNKLTWERRIQILNDIVFTVSTIHKENAIHRDLHSGNILYVKAVTCVSDLGFCGPTDKPLNSIYGNLPYIAPEVIAKMEYSFASDVYSIGMIMWEISSGQPPFVCKHDYDLAIKIVDGMRPRIKPGTPLEYKELMEQCWDADPTKRPDIYTLYEKIRDINKLYLLNENDKQWTNNITNIDNFQLNTNYSISSISSINSFFRNSSSKIYCFKDLPEPRNATKGKKKKFNYQD